MVTSGTKHRLGTDWARAGTARTRHERARHELGTSGHGTNWAQAGTARTVHERARHGRAGHELGTG
jgi:hypothetical protein